MSYGAALKSIIFIFELKELHSIEVEVCNWIFVIYRNVSKKQIRFVELSLLCNLSCISMVDYIRIHIWEHHRVKKKGAEYNKVLSKGTDYKYYEKIVLF